MNIKYIIFKMINTMNDDIINNILEYICDEISMKVNMNNLCNDVKWEIHTFINGTPATNYKQVLKDIHNYWDLKDNLGLDIEIECHNEYCNNVRWSSKMFKIFKNPKSNRKIINEYCSQRCINHQKVIEQQRRVLSFVI